MITRKSPSAPNRSHLNEGGCVFLGQGAKGRHRLNVNMALFCVAVGHLFCPI